MATCFYPTNGFSIFFEPVAGDSTKFNLMEQPPTGIFLESRNILCRNLANGRGIGSTARTEVRYDCGRSRRATNPRGALELTAVAVIAIAMNM